MNAAFHWAPAVLSAAVLWFAIRVRLACRADRIRAEASLAELKANIEAERARDA